MIEIKKDVAYWCKTEELAKEFLEECNKQGYKWLSGEDLLSYPAYFCEKDNTCYIYIEDYNWQGFGFINKNFAMKEGKTIIEYVSTKTTLEDRINKLEDELSKITKNMDLLSDLIMKKVI